VVVAGAARGDEPTLSIHLAPASYSGCGAVDADTMSCGDLVTSGDNAGSQFGFVVMSGRSGVAGVQFGVEYDAEVSVSGWTLCTGGLQIPEEDWPDSGTGLAATWDGTEYPSGPDSLVVVGYFTFEAASTGSATLTPDARIGEAAFVDEDGYYHSLLAGYLGEVSVDGGASGAHSCGLVDSTSAAHGGWELYPSGGGGDSEESSSGAFSQLEPHWYHLYPTSSSLPLDDYVGLGLATAPSSTSSMSVYSLSDDGAGTLDRQLSTYADDANDEWDYLSGYVAPDWSDVDSDTDVAMEDRVGMRRRVVITDSGLVMVGQTINDGTDTKVVFRLYDEDTGTVIDSYEFSETGTDSLVAMSQSGEFIAAGISGGTWPSKAFALYFDLGQSPDNVQPEWTRDLGGSASRMMRDLTLDSGGSVVAGCRGVPADETGTVYVLDSEDGEVSDEIIVDWVDMRWCPSEPAFGFLEFVRTGEDGRIYVGATSLCSHVGPYQNRLVVDVRAYEDGGSGFAEVWRGELPAPFGDHLRIDDMQVYAPDTETSARIWFAGSAEAADEVNWRWMVLGFDGDECAVDPDCAWSHFTDGHLWAHALEDRARAIALDPNGRHAYIVGEVGVARPGPTADLDLHLAAYDWEDEENRRTTAWVFDAPCLSCDPPRGAQVDNRGWDVALDGDGHVYVTGDTHLTSTYGDTAGRYALTMKFGWTGGTVSVGDRPTIAPPSPLRVRAGTRLDVSVVGADAEVVVYDVAGRRVAGPVSLEAGTTRAFDPAPGIYFVRAVTQDQSYVARGVIVR
jgi:hypothetical protein